MTTKTCSFNIRRLTNLTSGNIRYRPAVNQVEINWFNPQPNLVSWSKEKGILLEAYSPLGSGRRVKQGLQVQAVKEVAKELGITPAQVILSWLHQRGIVILPKSANAERIKENLEGQAERAYHPRGH
jgi:diketogulonate reductase-like aldo/keto reductase